jgi:6-phosphogluconolactonase
VNIVVAPDHQQLGVIAGRWVATRLVNAVRRRGSATIAFSGGSTPKAMLAVLAGQPVPWSEVTVYQVDERCAPDGHEARNANLLDVLPLPKRNLKLMPVTASNLAAAARRYGASLPAEFDVVHLGLGPDGHTASWAPGNPVVDNPSPVATIGTYNGWPRMTMTPGPVNAARQRLMEIVGADKAEMVARWLLHDHEIAVSRLRRTGTTVILDAAAAALLPEGR